MLEKARKKAVQAEVHSLISLHRELTGRLDVRMFAEETRFSERIGIAFPPKLPVVVGTLVAPSVCDRYVADMESP